MLSKASLWKLWNSAGAQGHSPGSSATGNRHGKKHKSVHVGTFDLYYLDQRSNDYICLKDYNKGQRCKKGQFNPIGETASEPGTHRTKAVKGYKHKDKGLPLPCQWLFCQEWGTDTFTKWQFTAIPTCACPEQQLGLHSGRTHFQLKSTFILYTCSLQPGSDAVTDLVPSYGRTSNFIFFFSLQVSAQ